MKSQINLEDFTKLDLRIGEVVAAEEVEGSSKLLKLTVDFGPEMGQKTVFSGIKKWYTAASLLNKKFIFLTNLAPKEFKFGISEGMILAAQKDETVALLTTNQDVSNGTQVK